MQDSQAAKHFADGTFPVKTKILSIFSYLIYLLVWEAQKQQSELRACYKDTS